MKNQGLLTEDEKGGTGRQKRCVGKEKERVELRAMIDNLKQKETGRR